jgi:serine protease AprX
MNGLASGLAIRYRLRFAVAITMAALLLLTVGARVSHAQTTGTTSEYIVEMQAGYTPTQGRDIVAELGGQVTTPTLPVINGFGAMLDDESADELSARPGVASVTMNTDLGGDNATSGGGRCPQVNVRKKAPKLKGNAATRIPNPQTAIGKLAQPLQTTIGADKAWNRGVNGTGVGVAVVDTGVAGYVPDFMSGGQSRVIASAVTNPCATDADDHVGHGTHVAGLIAGNSVGYGGAAINGRYMGVAPKANIVSVKVSDDGGDTTVLDVIYGLQFVVDNRDSLGIRVVNLSLSASVAESYKTDPLDAAAEAAWFAGIVVVAASGNDGAVDGAVSYSPGNDPYVITTGALDDRGTASLTDDVVPGWSSRGVTQDGFAKPDVLAPGTKLVAALAPSSTFPSLCRTCTVGRTYFRLSGTSMATAVVSGTAALMLQNRPGLTPNQVKGTLVSTARRLTGGGPAVDANAALDGQGTANGGLAPSTLIDPATGGIDWSRASFRRASFRDAAGSPFGALWTRASFRCDCGLDASGEIDSSRASFRRVSFRRNYDF